MSGEQVPGHQVIHETNPLIYIYDATIGVLMQNIFVMIYPYKIGITTARM